MSAKKTQLHTTKQHNNNNWRTQRIRNMKNFYTCVWVQCKERQEIINNVNNGVLFYSNEMT